jgi:hypothetical protein
VDNTWRLVSAVTADTALACVTVRLAGGGDPSFESGEPVWLLPLDAAASLASAHQAELDELESSR